jgi:glycosyltransferase involved in cell wall biosynthesis
METDKQNPDDARARTHEVVAIEPRVSVVVPVRDGAAHLARCLDALGASDFAPFEIVVVDDASSDGSARIAEAHGARVVRLVARSGPAAARNRGARESRASVLVFVDADVEVRRDTLARLAAHFATPMDSHTAALSSTSRRVAAVFGSYDDDPAERNFVSRFKNLFHHYTHQQSPRRASTFWAGCGAIRREAFIATGGFDARRYARPSVEDIELGYRLRRAGYEITLDRDAQAKHLKRWTLRTLLRADIRDRAVPWSRLILAESALVDELNLRVADRVSASLVCLAVLLATLAALAALAIVARALPVSHLDARSFLPLVASATASLAVAVWINRGLYKFFRRACGMRFAIAACAMHLLYFFYSAATFALCASTHVARKLTARERDATREGSKLKRLRVEGLTDD